MHTLRTYIEKFARLTSNNKIPRVTHVYVKLGKQNRYWQCGKAKQRSFPDARANANYRRMYFLYLSAQQEQNNTHQQQRATAAADRYFAGRVCVQEDQEVWREEWETGFWTWMKNELKKSVYSWWVEPLFGIVVNMFENEIEIFLCLVLHAVWNCSFTDTCPQSGL